MKQSDVNQLVDAFKNVFATKDDLQSMEVRQDKKFTTKDDLNILLTKEEFEKRHNVLLKNIVTNEIFDERVGFVIEQKLDMKIKFLPTKDEFFTRMDELLGEVKAMREEQAAHAGQHRDINDTIDDHIQRIDVLEKRLKSSPVPLSSLT